MRLAILLFVFNLPSAVFAAGPALDYVSYECSPPMALHNFKEHLEHGDATQAINWSAIPVVDPDPSARLTFEMQHGHHNFPKLDLFMWRREGHDEFEQYRCLTGFNFQPLCVGRPVTVFNIQDLNITHYAEFGTLLSHGSRLIVAGQAAILLDSAQRNMALCKLSTLHVRGENDFTMSAPPAFKTNYRALEPWLRELLKSDSFRGAARCGATLQF